MYFCDSIFYEVVVKNSIKYWSRSTIDRIPRGLGAKLYIQVLFLWSRSSMDRIEVS